MFVLSKLLSAITQPLTWVAVGLLVGVWLLPHKPVWGRRTLCCAVCVLGLMGCQVVPDALLRQLENQYPVPDPSAYASHSGIIVLGGALEHPRIFQAHGQVPLGEAAERMVVPVPLMHEHTAWELVFSGGEGRLNPTGITEAQLAHAFYTAHGLPTQRLRFDSRARNTRENAVFTAELLGSQCASQTWLLVTSASHMPRAMAEFATTGCQVTPFPVDFRTGVATLWYEYAMANSLVQWQVALHEYLGLWVYRVTR